MKSYNKEQLLTLLKELGVNTRASFRKYSNLPDSVWEPHFGSWKEFIRAGNMEDNMYTSRFKAAIARQEQHSDTLKKVQVDKESWAGKYTKTSPERFQTILCGSDIHDKLCDPFYRRLFIDTAKRAQPNKIVLAGDTFEMYEFSRYNKDPRNMDIVGAIKWVNEFLKDLREACNTAEIVMLEGNHECYSFDTEVLTDKGFTPAIDIIDMPDVKVASYRDGKLTYAEPLAKQITEPKQLYNIKTSLTDEIVSEGHNLFINNELVKLSSILHNNSHDNLSYKNFTTKVDYTSTPYPIEDDFISLSTQIVTDSSLVFVSGKLKRIQWKLSKQRKLARLRELLDRNNIPYTFRKTIKGGANVLQPYYICVYTNAARELISKCLVDNKQFSRDITKLNNRQLRILIDELAITDGSYRYNHMIWITTNKLNADLVAEACFLNSIDSKTSIKPPKANSGFKGKESKTQYHQSIYYNYYQGNNSCKITTLNIEPTIAIQTVGGTAVTRLNGKTQVTGNCRLIKYIYEMSPSLVPILSDIHDMGFMRLLGLDKYEVNYVGKSSLLYHKETDLKSEIKKNYYMAYDTVLFHHFPYAKDWGYAGVNGHHHKHLVDHRFSATKGPYEWHQLGGGHVRQAEYCEGEVWTNGFILCHVDTVKKYTQFEYIDCTGEACMIGGKWYTRLPEEIVKLS